MICGLVENLWVGYVVLRLQKYTINPYARAKGREIFHQANGTEFEGKQSRGEVGGMEVGGVGYVRLDNGFSTLRVSHQKKRPATRDAELLKKV